MNRKRAASGFSHHLTASPNTIGQRCVWAGNDPDYQAYHDQEWGVPVHDENLLFEFICLEGQQAGLSWITILRKRPHYRKCFHKFEVDKVAKMTDNKIEKLLLDVGLVRNRLKLYSIRSNANAFQSVQQEFGSFDSYIWDFVSRKPLDGKRRSARDIPVSTELSEAMSRDLKQRGFKFVGSTICYAFMQAAGLINDHTMDCFRYHELQQNS